MELDRFRPWYRGSARWAMILAAGTVGLTAETPTTSSSPSKTAPAPKTAPARMMAMAAAPGSSVSFAEPLGTRQVSEGWSVDTALGRLKVAIPLGQMLGELSFPVSLNLDGATSSTTYLDANNATQTSTHKITSGFTLGFGVSPYSASRYILENGQVLSDTDFATTQATFTTYAANVDALFTAFGFTPVPLSDTCAVNASGDLLKADVPATYGFGSKYGTVLAGLVPNSAFFGTLSGYTLLMDKDRVRVLATCGGYAYPIFMADRFGHFVTFEWSRNLAPSGDSVASITRVELRNQRQEGLTLRMLDWASAAAPTTETVKDLARLDYANVSGPSVLVQGYPSLPGVSGSGLAGRPTAVRFGTPESLVQPTWSGTYGAASAAPATVPSDTTVSERTWTLAYDTNHEEITTLTDASGLQSSFTYTPYATFNDKQSTASFVSTYTVRGVSQVDQTDTSGKSSATRRLTWTRQIAAPTLRINAETVAQTDMWDPATNPTTDRTAKFFFGDLATTSSPLNNLTDYQNGFYAKWVLLGADGATELASQERTSRTVALSQGGGLNKTLSYLQSSTSKRQWEATTGTQIDYVDATSLQTAQVRSLVGGKTVASKAYQYDTRWSMLQPGQVKRIDEGRYDSATSTLLTPGLRTTTNVWDTANPPLLQLQRTYADQGTLQHGSQLTYDAEGRPSTQAVFHTENGTALASPKVLTVTYDAATGQPATWTTSYTDGAGTGSLARTQGDFDRSQRPTLFIDEKGVSTRTTYDLYGRPLTVTKEGEAPVTMSYPDFWTTITVQSGKTTTETRDAFGRTLRTVLPDGTVRVPTYDLHGRVIRTTETNTNSATRVSTATFDPLDRVTSQVSATGQRVDFAYTTDGVNNLVTQTVDPAGLKLVTVTTTDPWGQGVSVKAPNGDVTTTTFDGWGLRKEVKITPAGGGTAQTRTFSYDVLGRLVSKTEPETGTQTFGSFNALNQAQTLTEGGINAGLPSRVRTLTYDGLGRLRQQAGGDVTESFLYEGPFLTKSTRTVGTETVTQTFGYQAPGAKLSREATTTP